MSTGSTMLSLFTSLIFLCLVSISLSARIRPTSCSYYYYGYSYSYANRCCAYETGYSVSSYYTSYCPSRSVLSSNCTGYSCCNVTVPVNTGYNTFYYYEYFCPNYYYYYNYYTYRGYYPTRSCGFYCASTASFATVGFCFCLCGFGFTISLCIIVKFIIGQKKNPATIYSYSPHNPVRVPTGPENINFKAQLSDVPPPPYPNYITNPSNPYPGRNITPGTNPLLAHSTGATAYPPEPAAVDTTESSALITGVDPAQYPELTAGVTANPAQDSDV